MMSNMRWLKTKREPVEMSVADARIIGPLPRLRSPNVAPLNRISSYSCAASSERPQPSDERSAPVSRTEGAGDDLALHVALQEALLVVVEQLVAVEAVGQRGEAAARHAGDDVDWQSSRRTLLPFGPTISVRRRNSSTPYENAAARVPPPEKARTTRFSLLLISGWRVSKR